MVVTCHQRLAFSFFANQRGIPSVNLAELSQASLKSWTTPRISGYTTRLRGGKQPRSGYMSLLKIRTTTAVHYPWHKGLLLFVYTSSVPPGAGAGRAGTRTLLSVSLYLSLQPETNPIRGRISLGMVRARNKILKFPDPEAHFSRR